VSAAVSPLSIKGEHVVLRDFTLADVEDAAAVVGDHRVTRWLSVAVLKRLGFALEGRLRDHVHTNGAWRDSLLFALLADDHQLR
jgi:L-amino acid N-acyltransferase YncA